MKEKILNESLSAAKKSIKSIEKEINYWKKERKKTERNLLEIDLQIELEEKELIETKKYAQKISKQLKSIK